MQILFADRDNNAVSLYMPQLVERIERFCVNYDTDTKPEEAREFIWRMFGTRDFRMGLWFVVDDAHRVVAHLLAQPEPFDYQGNAKYMLVRQAEVDDGVDSREEDRLIFGAVEKFAQYHGAPEIRMVTHRNEKVFARAWGFRPFKAIMRRDVPPKEPTAPS